MKKVLIKNMSIRNFKGIASLDIAFNEKRTQIRASNGSGKTSLKNAWEWVLTQNIGNVTPNINNKDLFLDTAVEVTLNVDDNEYKVKRINHCKIRDGAKIGSENIYYIDDIEFKQKDYAERISDILGDGTIKNLPILTDKEYFNTDTTTWKWTDRRKLLMQITNAEELSKDLIKNDKYTSIAGYIAKGYYPNEIKTQLAKEEKLYSEEQKKRLILIEQKQKEMNEYLGVDYETTSQNLAIAKTKLTKLEHKEQSEEYAKELQDLTEKYLSIQKQVTALQTADELQKQKLRNQSLTQYKFANDLVFDITKLKNKLKELSVALESKAEATCPVCGQPIPADKLESAKQHKKELEEEYTKTLAEHDKQMSYYQGFKHEFERLDAEYKNFVPNAQINELQNQLQDLKTTIENKRKENSKNDTDQEKNSLKYTILEYEKVMMGKEFLEKGGKQVKQWKQEMGEFADKVVEIQKKQAVLQDFVREQTELISKTVNNYFQNGITWSLFNTNLNGNIEETCICLYNGKRYCDLSTGEKNVANIEVIKTLQKWFDIEIVMFADNHETMTLPYDVDNQIIELYAEPNKSIDGCVKIKDIY